VPTQGKELTPVGILDPREGINTPVGKESQQRTQRRAKLQRISQQKINKENKATMDQVNVPTKEDIVPLM
jgi:hypothetical protein